MYFGEKKIGDPSKPYANQLPVKVNNSKSNKKKKLKQPEIAYPVPVVGPVRDENVKQKIVVVGTMKGMRHERQTPAFKIIVTEEDYPRKREKRHLI